MTEELNEVLVSLIEVPDRKNIVNKLYWKIALSAFEVTHWNVFVPPTPRLMTTRKPSKEVGSPSTTPSPSMEQPECHKKMCVNILR